jgi:hypothetical protein
MPGLGTVLNCGGQDTVGDRQRHANYNFTENMVRDRPLNPCKIILLLDRMKTPKRFVLSKSGALMKNGAGAGGGFGGSEQTEGIDDGRLALGFCRWVHAGP